jgi:hypothetical protein
MADKISVADKIDALASIVEKGFAAIASDIGNINERIETLATKEQIISLHGQVNAIETELRDTKRYTLITRVADLEEKVFGASRD